MLNENIKPRLQITLTKQQIGYLHYEQSYAKTVQQLQNLAMRLRLLVIDHKKRSMYSAFKNNSLLHAAQLFQQKKAKECAKGNHNINQRPYHHRQHLAKLHQPMRQPLQMYQSRMILCFAFTALLTTAKLLQCFFKNNGASRKACITAARLTCSGRGCVSCERAASPSKSSVVGSTSTCKTFAAGSALSDAASALQRCCSTYCTHCTSVDGEPSQQKQMVGLGTVVQLSREFASHGLLKDNKKGCTSVCQPFCAKYITLVLTSPHVRIFPLLQLTLQKRANLGWLVHVAKYTNIT